MPVLCGYSYMNHKTGMYEAFGWPQQWACIWRGTCRMYPASPDSEIAC